MRRREYRRKGSTIIDTLASGSGGLAMKEITLEKLATSFEGFTRVPWGGYA